MTFPAKSLSTYLLKDSCRNLPVLIKTVHSWWTSWKIHLCGREQQCNCPQHAQDVDTEPQRIARYCCTHHRWLDHVIFLIYFLWPGTSIAFHYQTSNSITRVHSDSLAEVMLAWINHGYDMSITFVASKHSVCNPLKIILKIK